MRDEKDAEAEGKALQPHAHSLRAHQGRGAGCVVSPEAMQKLRMRSLWLPEYGGLVT